MDARPIDWAGIAELDGLTLVRKPRIHHRVLRSLRGLFAPRSEKARRRTHMRLKRSLIRSRGSVRSLRGLGWPRPGFLFVSRFVHHSPRPDGETGRRKGLKIPRPKGLWGFDSHSGHQAGFASGVINGGGTECGIPEPGASTTRASASSDWVMSGLPLAVEFGRRYDTVGLRHRCYERIASLRQGRGRPQSRSRPDESAASTRLRLRRQRWMTLRESQRLHRHRADADRRAQAPGPLGPAVGQPRRSAGAQARRRRDLRITVYPGATEEDLRARCSSALGPDFNSDFFVGYSPERINPGDKQHRLANIIEGDRRDRRREAADFVDALYRQHRHGRHPQGVQPSGSPRPPR